MAQKVGKMKKLILLKNTSSYSSPAHHQFGSPGTTLVETDYLTPREAYELGMHSKQVESEYSL